MYKWNILTRKSASRHQNDDFESPDANFELFNVQNKRCWTKMSLKDHFSTFWNFHFEKSSQFSKTAPSAMFQALRARNPMTDPLGTKCFN